MTDAKDAAGVGGTYIYIVFSGTVCKMGSFIRAVTHGRYNHMSVALDAELNEMYSFARLKRETPFCGGFVREGAERYRSAPGEASAEVSICRIPTDAAGYARVRARIDEMCRHPGFYVYNMFSAALVPLRKRVDVRDSFTCVEFALEMLRLSGMKLAGSYYSIAELYALLRRGEIYRGEFPDSAAKYDFDYAGHVSVVRRFGSSASQLWRLTLRLAPNPKRGRRDIK